MFTQNKYKLLFSAAYLICLESCVSELPPPPITLSMYSPGDTVPSPEYMDIIVRREGEDLTLVCELKNGPPRVFLWNYLAGNGTGKVSDSPYTYPIDVNPKMNSSLTLRKLEKSDSGRYICSAPPYSQVKYLLVQPPSTMTCATGAFVCGHHCVLAIYVCDGRNDCREGEDEKRELCIDNPCLRPDRMNCSGRCIPSAACCARTDSLCTQPGCCNSYRDAYVEMDYSAHYEDRHAPDDMGFIQSTIYTVTACALIFMIAVVLLVSAICKMHMKRTALRSYAHHYDVRYAQAYRFPPCYESREDARQISPTHSYNGQTPTSPENAEEPEVENASGLARLAAMFTNRYRQVPTQPEVEMTDVRSTSLNSTPSRNRPRSRLNNYRSPTYCDLNTTDFYFNAETNGPELNYMATPLEFFRRRTLRSNSVIEPLNTTQRPLTLQLGRFQLSIPRFGRRNSSERRPDTPNIAEINIEDVDFVRLNSNETYTLNGRTIRLLGGNFENYPILNEANRPPPYTDAMRYKLYGPPPEYLSRDGLNERSVVNATVDEEARTNIEMPPCYDDLSNQNNVNNNGNDIPVNNENNNASGITVNNDNNNYVSVNNEENRADTARALSVENINNNVLSIASTTSAIQNLTDNIINHSQNNETISSVIDRLPAIDSDVNANETVNNDNGNNVIIV